MRIRKDWSAWDPGINFKVLPGAMGIYEVGEDNPAIDVAKYDPKADKMKPPRIIKERRSMV